MTQIKTKIPSELEPAAVGGMVTDAKYIKDRVKNKTQVEVNADTEERVSTLEESVGTGGSVDERIAEEGAKHYLKTETYSKTELNNMITTPNQEYVTVTATDQTTAVTDVLPATGEADTIYRVGNWDGTQYDTACYTEYAWNGSAYVALNTKEYGVDEEPTAGSNNLVKSGGVATNFSDAKLLTLYLSGNILPYNGALSTINNDSNVDVTKMYAAIGVSAQNEGKIMRYVNGAWEYYPTNLRYSDFSNIVGTDDNNINKTGSVSSYKIQNNNIESIRSIKDFLKSWNFRIPIQYRQGGINGTSGKYKYSSTVICTQPIYAIDAPILVKVPSGFKVKEYRFNSLGVIAEVSNEYVADHVFIGTYGENYYDVFTIAKTDGSVIVTDDIINTNFGIYYCDGQFFKNALLGNIEFYRGGLGTLLNDADKSAKHDMIYIVNKSDSADYRKLMSYNGITWIVRSDYNYYDLINQVIQNTFDRTENYKNLANYIHKAKQGYINVNGEEQLSVVSQFAIFDYIDISLYNKDLYKIYYNGLSTIATSGGNSICYRFLSNTLEVISVSPLQHGDIISIPSGAYYIQFSVKETEINDIVIKPIISKNDTPAPTPTDNTLENDKSLRFAVFSDLHYGVGGNDNNRVAELLNAIENEMISSHLDFVIFNGDMVDCHDNTKDPDAEYAYLKENLLDKIKCPVYFTLGNHDGVTDIATLKHYYLENDEYSVETDDYYFIFLNSYYLGARDETIPQKWALSGVNTTFLNAELTKCTSLNKIPVVVIHQLTDYTSDTTITNILKTYPHSILIYAHTHGVENELHSNGVYFLCDGCFLDSLKTYAVVEMTTTELKSTIVNLTDNTRTSNSIMTVNKNPSANIVFYKDR